MLPVASLIRRFRLMLVMALAAVVTLAGQAPRPPVLTPQPFDTVILNGRVIDGTGAAALVTDIGIRGGRVAELGNLKTAETHARFDAAGLTIAPGFIDVHTHADDIADHPLAENFAQMGVTTIVAGNCGSSALNIGAAIERVRNVGVSVNFATLIGHNTVRQSVMGTDNRFPSVTELNKMKALVFEGMADGAVGFSTGLQYIPGTYAKNFEITVLAHIAANEGGIYATHMRNEGTALEAAVKESIQVAYLIDGPVQISHLKVDSPAQWGSAATALALIDAARKRGLKVQADQYAYTAGSSSLSIRFPAWALEGGAAEVTKRLTDEVTWSKIKKEMVGLLSERGFVDLAWATIATYRPDPSLNGLTMQQAAEKTKGSGSADAQLELARNMQMNGGASMVYHFLSDADVATIMAHPFVAIASDAGINVLSQGVPHPRGYGDNARVLGKYVRDEKVISLEDAVRKMTSLPAQHFGFADRGVIREKAFADLVIFDPATISDRATYEKPHAYPAGIAAVFVNGVMTITQGVHTGAKAGMVVTKLRK
jgi:N-acyl-D-amino-acid deacylase